MLKSDSQCFIIILLVAIRIIFMPSSAEVICMMTFTTACDVMVS